MKNSNHFEGSSQSHFYWQDSILMKYSAFLGVNNVSSVHCTKNLGPKYNVMQIEVMEINAPLD